MCLYLRHTPPPSQPGLETGGGGGLGRGGDQLTKNEADEKINPVARNETETEGRGEDDGDFRTAAGGGGGGEMERKQERME